MSRVADPRTRISLLRAAEEVFAKKGLDAAKVEEIAKLAGVSKGAFYLHFEGKEEAFLHVVEAFLARCGSMLSEPSENFVPTRPDELMELGLEQDVQMFEFLWQNRAILAILHTCKGEYAYLFDAFRKELHQNVRHWIEFLSARGVYRRDLDPQLAATLIVGAHGELAEAMLQSDKKPPLRDWLLATRRIFCLGLAADPSFWERQHVSHVSLPHIPDPLPSEPVERTRRANAATPSKRVTTRPRTAK